jgi:hypothetical protein
MFDLLYKQVVPLAVGVNIDHAILDIPGYATPPGR